MKKILTALLVLLLAGGIFFALYGGKPAAAPFSLPEIRSGQTISQENLQGKVTLINFWYPSCPGCVVEMPRLIALDKARRGTDFQILAVSLNYNTPQEVETYIEKNALPFAVMYDSGNRTAEAYGATLFPSSFIIDRQGKIVRTYLGEPDWAELDALIDRLLKK